MNLLVFNLAMDADDPVLGHTTSWTNALARRCDHVSVITMRAGRLDVEPNVEVHTLGKELGLSEPRRLARFYGLMHSALRERRIDACFAHMAPLFAVLFAPVAKSKRIPILLWYAHSSVTPTLRLAHALVDRCVTASADGFRLSSEKLFVIGHGVDVERFRPPSTTGPVYGRTAVSVGRIAPVKRIDEMVDALSILRDRGLDLRLRLFGSASTADDRRYEADLRQRVTSDRLTDQVSFDGPVPFPEIPHAYRCGGVFVNLSETGAIDKAILESMASGCVPVSRNASYAAIVRDQDLDWLVPGSGAASVADQIVRALELPADARSSIVRRLRKIVIDQHGLDRLADSTIAHLQELAVQSTRGRSGRAWV